MAALQGERRAGGAARAAALAAAGLWAAGCANLRPGPADGALPAVPPARPAAASRAAGCDAGPLACADRDEAGRERWRALGPLFERRAGADGSGLWAARPFFSRTADPTNQVWRADWLWPVGVSKRLQDQSSWRFLTAYGTDFDVRDPDSRYRWVVFPVLFRGRDREGRSYFAVFPLGGRLHEYLGQDRIRFALFPLYADTRFKDQETRHVLWPIVAWSRGGATERWRVFPLYGYARHGAARENRFVLWPIWTSVRTHGSGQEGGGFMLFPLYGHSRVGPLESRMVLPPFFRWSRDRRDRTVYCPWPLVQWSFGSTEKLYLWPVWGRKEVGGAASGFWLWPLGHWRRQPRPDGVERTFRLLPFVNYRARQAPEPAAAAQAATERDLQIWPLFSYRRAGEARRWRALDLWPVKDTPGIERNWAPFWTLCAASHSAAGGGQREALWGLYRQRWDSLGASHVSLFPLYAADRRPGGAVRRSFLLGLVEHEKEGAQTRLRLLYFLRFGSRPGAGEPPAARADPGAETDGRP